ncbi:MAG: IS1 family transposase [Bacteroidetes bacterium]|nr:IS1 family transposase [Bacteroidota bacterium]
MLCHKCRGVCQKAGRQWNGAQKLCCVRCGKYRQSTYKNNAYEEKVDGMIRSLLCESVGISGIARVLGIAKGTVLSRIRLLADNVERPCSIRADAVLEVDELWTYIGRNDNDYWVAYALNRKTREVVDFVVGKRTKTMLKGLIDRLLLLKPVKIRTDKFTLYSRLIPKAFHRSDVYGINRIERKNLYR